MRLGAAEPEQEGLAGLPRSQEIVEDGYVLDSGDPNM
jgi:hypothetical protein